MKLKNDLTHMIFGKLKVLGCNGQNKWHRSLWTCQCECGIIKIIDYTNLISGSTISCGCSKQKFLSHFAKQNIIHGDCRRTKRRAEYSAWHNMWQRCTNPNNKDWDIYGGRGIKVCSHWKKYINFFNDIGRKPGPTYSLDRINSDGNYEPKNCKWSTLSEQNLNRDFKRRQK